MKAVVDAVVQAVEDKGLDMLNPKSVGYYAAFKDLNNWQWP